MSDTKLYGNSITIQEPTKNGVNRLILQQKFEFSNSSRKVELYKIIEKLTF